MPSSKRYDENTYCDDEVKNIIENIWSAFSQNVQDKWLESIEIPISSEVAMSKLKNLVAWATLQHDGNVCPNEVLEHKVADVEPTPILLDSWARGSGIYF